MECRLCLQGEGEMCINANYLRSQMEKYANRSDDGTSGQASKFTLAAVDSLISGSYRKLEFCLNNDQLKEAIEEAEEIKQNRFGA